MLLYSIIIPTYNSESHIKTILDSVLSQTFTDFEIVLMDGDSKDNTIAVAKSYNDSRLRIYSEPDKGVYDAMNKGMTLAKGEWLYFIGSDDYFNSSAVLQDLSQSLSRMKNHVLYGNVRIKGDTGWAKDGQIYNGKFSFQKLLKSNICHQSMFYRRSFILKHQLKYDLKYPVSADWDFNIACRMKTDFTYVNNTVAVFNAGGISTGSINEPFLDERKIKYADLYQKYKPGIQQRFYNKIRFVIKKILN